MTRYEREYPGVTYIVDELGDYDVSHEPITRFTTAGGEWPSLLKTRDTTLGALSLDSFLQSPIFTDDNCNVTEVFPSTPPKRVSDQIDAFLYLGPQTSRLSEPVPADIALDRAYRSEWLRRMKLVGLPAPSSLEELDAQTIASAAEPVMAPPSREPIPQDLKSRLRQECLRTK